MTRPRLWSWQLSPYSAKARIALAEKGVDIELLEIDPVKRPSRLRELNPTNTVPVLELDGVAVRESTPICEWLEETYPEPSLWPAGSAQRAAARGLLLWVDNELTANFFLSMRKEAFGLASTDHPDLVTTLRERLTRRWATVETQLASTDGPWMLQGEHPTLVDLAAIPLAVRLPQWKPELAPAPEQYPLTAAWLESLRNRPSAAEVDRRGAPIADDLAG